MEASSPKAEPTGSGHAEAAGSSLHQILREADPADALGRILGQLSDTLPPSIMVMYRFSPDRSVSQSLGLTPDRELTPAGLAPKRVLVGSSALDKWVGQLAEGETVLAPIAELPREERRRIAKTGLRSILASPVMVGGQLVAVFTCLSETGVDEWRDEHRALCDLAADAIGVAILRERAVSHERLEALLAFSFDLVSVLDPDGTIVYNTPRFAPALGAPVQELLGRSALDLIHPRDKPRATRALQRLLELPNDQQRVEARLKHADGTWRHFELIGTNQLDNPLINGIVITAIDVTARKNLERQLNWQALHDPLTKLANRALLQRDLRRSLYRAQRSGGTVVLLYLDLDRFKDVNDRFGHLAGDQLLVCIAERLRASVRIGETVARMGGDEFVVLIEGRLTDDDLERVATRMLDAVRLPVGLSHGAVTVTASMGISVAAGEPVDPDEMLVQADAALYAAKRAGRARYHRYSPDPSGDGGIQFPDLDPRPR